jgi:hypothetical protein
MPRARHWLGGDRDYRRTDHLGSCGEPRGSRGTSATGTCSLSSPGPEPPARQQGSLRHGLAGSDIVFLQLALDAIMNASRQVTPQLYRCYLAIFLNGIRAEAADLDPLPVPALTEGQSQEVLSPPPAAAISNCTAAR